MSTGIDDWHIRLERRRFWADIAKHLLWAVVAICGVLVLASAIRTTRPPARETVTIQAAPAATPAQALAAREKLEVQFRQQGLGPNVRLDVGQVWEALTPLVRSGEVAPEAASEVISNVIQGGREIAVDAVSQLLERVLRSKTTVAAGGTGGTVTQTCAPILTVEAPARATIPRPPAPPRVTTPRPPAPATPSACASGK